MIALVRRLLNLLFKLGIYSKHFKLVYDGDLVSWNQIYSSKHWSFRSGKKQEYQKIFTILALQAKMTKLSEMSLVVFYNNKMDVDNVSLTTKWAADSFKGKYIEDDSSKYYKGLMIFHDPALPKKRIEIHVIGK